MANELVIRLQRDDEGRHPVVRVEADGVPIGLISRLNLEVDSKSPVPQLEIELLRGFLMKSDLPEDVRESLIEVEQILKKHHVKVKAPV